MLWGYIRSTTSSKSSVTVTFPTSFFTNCYIALTTNDNLQAYSTNNNCSHSYAVGVSAAIYNLTKNGFIFHFMYNTKNYWLAIGI